MPLAAHAEDDPSLFSRFTMAKIDPSSKLMWAHWLCALSYLAWTLLLLDYHYQSYVALRCARKRQRCLWSWGS